MMTLLINRYTLKEVLESLSLYDERYDTGLAGEDMFTDLLEAVGFDPDYFTNETKSDEANILWCTYIVPMYREMCAIQRVKGDPDETDLHEWFTKFIRTLNQTYFKYGYLVKEYKSQMDHLMDKIGTSSTSRFNDTPQNNESGSFDWSDDSHLTNISKVDAESDVATPIARLDEIRALLTNSYVNWAYEFRMLFLYF